MIKKWFIIMSFILLIGLQGCNKKSINSKEINISDNKEYNLLVTNNTPLSMKSIVVKLIGNSGNKKDNKIDALIDSNIKTGEVGKFYLSEVGSLKYKIILNPKNNYSVSQDFEEIINDKVVLKYDVVIEQNEIKIIKSTDLSK